jgi:hypothetical protein
MGPGVIILCMMRDEEIPSEHLYDDIPLSPAKDFEWMFWRAKIRWLESLYKEATVANPVVHMFHCTSLDLLSYLYKNKKDNDTVTMVIVKVFKDGQVIETEEFFV